MQNTVYECKQNGEDFFSLLTVTYFCFGNRPANGLVIEHFAEYRNTAHFKRLTFNLYLFIIACFALYIPHK